VRKVPVDADFRLRVDCLERAIEEARRVRSTPFCVVASAGTVNTGAIDPIGCIADLCAREGLWLHVDGAYGALVILSAKMRDRLLARGRAGSISLDPHKLLYCAAGGGMFDRAEPRPTSRYVPFQILVPYS
jgi:aromatic-L-amino-acid decarboxylase